MTSRILHVSTVHRADDPRIYERECRSLARVREYEVMLAAPGTIPRNSRVAHLRLKRGFGGRIRRGGRSLWTSLSLAGSLEPDLWHFHDPELLPTAIVLARRGRRVLWDAHEDYHEQFSDPAGKAWIPDPFRGLARAPLVRLLEEADRTVSGVVAATPSIAARYSNARVAVVGNEAVLGDFVAAKPTFESRQVLFTGWGTPAHLFEEVVSAIAGIDGVTLAVAGRPAESNLWRKALVKLGDRLVYLGWLSRPGLVKAISESALGLVTYSRRRAYMDSSVSPTKLFEFAAAGLPVAASPIPASVQAIKAGGFGVVASDFGVESLQAAITLALEDRSEWESMSASARAWSIKEGGWNSSADRLLKLYEAVLESGPSH